MRRIGKGLYRRRARGWQKVKGNRGVREIDSHVQKSEQRLVVM